MPRTHIPEAVCPACGTQGMDYTAETVDLPYLGESLETLIRCDHCGYKHADFVLTETKEPTRWSYRITDGDDMMVRVVRSSSGTVRIPELGIEIEPGLASEAFISNIEGILVRVERVLAQLHTDAESDDALGRIEALQNVLGAMRDGQADPATLVLEDPFGNSSILAEKAVHEPIPEEEANRLKVGMMIVDPQGELAETLGGDEEEG
ncbi:MAG: ZPR1 zinc finger domain-containing protein [Thermoplasmatota archaeon]